MARLNVSLSPDLLAFVTALTQSGRYASASEVVRDGLRLLEREQASAAEMQALLQQAVDAGLADAQAGHFSTRTAGTIAQDLLRSTGHAP